ncbi:zinc-ribbon-domain-containing protein [Dipodascopsis tothii]|uniref:zinc-ribbon-domain-containing protein n=1 Tax=Dipodascopsis tothii TaxID=44089 RepID=UPI0034CE0135
MPSYIPQISSIGGFPPLSSIRLPDLLPRRGTNSMTNRVSTCSTNFDTVDETESEVSGGQNEASSEASSPPGLSRTTTVSSTESTSMTGHRLPSPPTSFATFLRQHASLFFSEELECSDDETSDLDHADPDESTVISRLHGSSNDCAECEASLCVLPEGEVDDGGKKDKLSAEGSCSHRQASSSRRLSNDLPLPDETSFGNTSFADENQSDTLPVDDLERQRILRQKIIAIQNLTVSDKEKAVLMHKLMTADYYRYRQAGKGKRVAEDTDGKSTFLEEDNKPVFILADEDLKTTWFDEENQILGCSHYRRAVKLQCSTCNEWHTCRFCHDEIVEDHNLIRMDTKNMLCMHCLTAQPAAQNCMNCDLRLARYYCDKCKLWDDDPDKSIYHCADCGICRIGEGLGKDFFHCKTCNVCMSICLENSHRCIEHSTECNCPICGEYMFTSTMTVVFMSCGHSIHQKCYYEHTKSSYKCPTCARSIINMESQFRLLDREIERQKLPEPYSNWRSVVSCNDCSGKSNIPFHFLGLKCDTCRSYNTALLRLIKPEEGVIDSEDFYDNNYVDFTVPTENQDS